MTVSPDALPLGFLINTVGRLMNAEASGLFAKRGLDPVSVGVLWTVGLMPGRTQRDYAAFQARDVTTYGRFVDRLSQKGLIARHEVPGDRRAWSLKLTKEGEALLAELGRDTRALEAGLSHGLAKAEDAALRRGLAAMLAALGGLAE
jgi:DNA-binding MarR family transcriptional regulator